MNKARKMLFFLLAMALVCSTLTMCVFADELFSGGSGTVGDPYKISTTADLLDLSAKTNAAATNAAFGSACYKLMNDIDMVGVSGFQGLNCIDIAWNYAYFAGTFDGNGHVIKNLTIAAGNSTRPRGFISELSGSGVVKNLGIENITITGGAQLGGIVGQATGTATLIENCYVRGASFSPKSTWQGKAAICGGVAANTDMVNIKNCYATGTGMGFCGYNIGGTQQYQMFATLENCYSDGALSGSSATNCYASATAQTVTAADLGSAYKDNPLPELQGGLPVLVWENVVAPKTDFSGGSGAPDDPYLISTAADLLELSGKTNSKDTNAQFSACYYKVTDDIDMTGMSGFQGLNCFENSVYFTGNFDGDGHIVKNLTIAAGDSTRPRGFISELSGNGVVKNLGIENITITGGAQLGGIVGQAQGTGAKIENCFVRGASFSPKSSWQGKAAICGGIYNNSNKVTIKNCYATGTSMSICGYSVGETAHQVHANLENCYTDGASLTIAALTSGSATNCYANVNDLSVSAAMLGDAYLANTDADYNYALPVLAWEASRFTPVAVPAVTKVSYESILTNGSNEKKAAPSEDDTDFYAMRFLFNVSGATAANNFGAYIIPFDVFSTSGKTNTALVTYTPDGETTVDFSADLMKIPYAARFRAIYAVPFVNGFAEPAQSFTVSAVEE